MEQNFNVDRRFKIFADKLTSIHANNNLIIETSNHSIDFSCNTLIFDGQVVLNRVICNNITISNVSEISSNFVYVNNIYLPENIKLKYNSVNDGYIRNIRVGYSPQDDTLGRSDAYFTYINVSGGDSSFNTNLYINKDLIVDGTLTISNDLLINGANFTSIENSFNIYKSALEQSFSSTKIFTKDMSTSNISISNDLYVHKTAYINDISINGQLLNSVLKVPNIFTIDPSGHGNASGTLIINGDLIVKGVQTSIASSIVDICDLAITLASNLANRLDLSNTNAGLDISNVASLKYNGTTWNFSGGQLTVENKKVMFLDDVSSAKRNFDLSVNAYKTDFSSSFFTLKRNIDNSYNATYTRFQIDNSFILKSNFDLSLTSLRSYVDSSYISKITFDGSFQDLITLMDTSYVARRRVGTLNSFDSSFATFTEKLDMSYILNSVFDASHNSLKQKFDISFATISATNIEASSIIIETINTKHPSQMFANSLWNQIGLDISNGPPLANNNIKIAVSNDGKVVALSSSSHSDISKGRIYVYELSNNQTSYNWTRLGLSSEIIIGVSNDDQFGWDIALSSDGRVVAGSSINSDASGNNCGQVRLFELSNNTNRWLQKGSVINGTRPGSESGYSISLAGNGNSIAIGAWKDNTNGTNAGAVRVYDFSAGVNDWRQKGQTIAGVSGSFEGYATALSLDGQTLASASILPGLLSISGGTVSTSSGYIIHSFTNVGTTPITVASPVSIDYLVIAGGGSGGGGRGGGGGAGGVRTGTMTLSAGSYNITVGAGGTSVISDNAGNNGGSSSISTLIVATGGGGGGGWNATIGINGGSGGGSSAGTTLAGGSGIAGQGFAGSARLDTITGGGGGGAGAAASGKDGAIGISSNITGTIRYYAGGGGAGANYFTMQHGIAFGGIYAVANGTYGGGNGASTTGTKQPFQDAVANTGGGGGGHEGGTATGAGGSGIVIIRYLAKSGSVKTFTLSGTTWNNKGTINGTDISFGRAIKLSTNGNTIVIGSPGYGQPITPTYELNSTIQIWEWHRTNALTVPGRSLASISNPTQNEQVRLMVSRDTWIGGKRKVYSTSDKTSATWEWTNGDPWIYYNWDVNEPGSLEDNVKIQTSGYWHDYYNNPSWTTEHGPAIYMNTLIPNLGQVYVYGFQGGTTWTQLGQAIQGISGGDEFGSSVSMSNDGTIIAVGSDTNSSNRGHVRVFVYANNYWYQLSNAIDGKTVSSKAGTHALSGDGATLIQSNNTYNSVYGINKTLTLIPSTTTINTTISGDLIVGGKGILKSFRISNKHIFDVSVNGYSSNYLATTDVSASIVDYYSNVGYTYNRVFRIDACGNVSNYSGIYGAVSDSRLKENIVTSSPKLEDLLKIRVVNYNLKGSDKTKYIGVLAQELEELFPELIAEDNTHERIKSVNYSTLTIMLIKAFQEQQVLINNLNMALEELEN